MLGFVALMLIRFLFGAEGSSFEIQWAALSGLGLLAGLGVLMGSGDDVRRVLNLFAALIGLVVTIPLLAFVAVAVKLTSTGPIIYSQKRVGIDRRRRNAETDHQCERDTDLGGKTFTIYKFRTMTASAGAQEQVWAAENDSRITPIGGLLRKSRLDELPQLVNVLLGDMNIVGPRPEQPAIFGRLESEVESYRLRQQVMPGITGWAQINHRYDTCMDDVKTKIKYDLEYIGRVSAGHDLGIMLRTIPVMLARKGAR